MFELVLNQVRYMVKSLMVMIKNLFKDLINMFFKDNTNEVKVNKKVNSKKYEKKKMKKKEKQTWNLVDRLIAENNVMKGSNMKDQKKCFQNKKQYQFDGNKSNSYYTKKSQNNLDIVSCYIDATMHEKTTVIETDAKSIFTIRQKGNNSYLCSELTIPGFTEVIMMPRLEDSDETIGELKNILNNDIMIKTEKQINVNRITYTHYTVPAIYEIITLNDDKKVVYVKLETKLPIINIETKKPIISAVVCVMDPNVNLLLGSYSVIKKNVYMVTRVYKETKTKNKIVLLRLVKNIERDFLIDIKPNNDTEENYNY